MFTNDCKTVVLCNIGGDLDDFGFAALMHFEHFIVNEVSYFKPCVLNDFDFWWHFLQRTATFTQHLLGMLNFLPGNQRSGLQF